MGIKAHAKQGSDQAIKGHNNQRSHLSSVTNVLGVIVAIGVGTGGATGAMPPLFSQNYP